MSAAEGVKRFYEIFARAEQSGRGKKVQSLLIPDEYSGWVLGFASDEMRVELLADSLLVGSFVAMAVRHRGLKILLAGKDGKVHPLPEPYRLPRQQHQNDVVRSSVGNGVYAIAESARIEASTTIPRLTHAGLQALGANACGQGLGIHEVVAADLVTHSPSRTFLVNDSAAVPLASNFDALPPFRA